jgi:PAS domain-containing protein
MDKQRAESSPAEKTAFETRILELEQELAACQKNCLSLDTERAHFELFANSVSDHAFVTLDANGVVVRWNGGAERLRGWQAQEVLGRPAAVFYTPEDGGVKFSSSPMVRGRLKRFD